MITREDAARAVAFLSEGNAWFSCTKSDDGTIDETGHTGSLAASVRDGVLVISHDGWSYSLGSGLHMDRDEVSIGDDSVTFIYRAPQGRTLATTFFRAGERTEAR